jgi:hypothetical protein
MIETFKKYLPLLDEVYKAASLTADLDGAAELVREGTNAGELVIPMLEMQGLGDYSRNGGYAQGDVTMTYETVKVNFDRGRMFQIDALDDEETQGLTFAKLASEFVRTKVVPELDAFRLATYASFAGVGAAAPAAITSASALVTALRAANDAMDDAEVPYDERYLYITPALHGMLLDMDTTKSKAVMDAFAKIVKVPQRRLVTAIDQQDGTSEGEQAGGYTKGADGKNINFMIVHKPAVIQYQKHVKPKIVTPEANQRADAWLYGYRNAGYASVYTNKVAGIYVHASNT